MSVSGRKNSQLLRIWHVAVSIVTNRNAERPGDGTTMTSDCPHETRPPSAWTPVGLGQLDTTEQAGGRLKRQIVCLSACHRYSPSHASDVASRSTLGASPLATT